MDKNKFKCGDCGCIFLGDRKTTWETANHGEYWMTGQGYVGKCPKCGGYARDVSPEEDDERAIDKTKKAFGAALGNSKKFFLCTVCAHKEVCRNIDEPSEQCENFMDATGPQRYASIYHFFQPIFDWIKFHYPAGEVKFIVDHNSAKMHIEHGPGVFSKEIIDFSSNIKSVGNENEKDG